jgi:hypothetical protein
MKLSLDYTKSSKQIPPPGQATLKFKSKAQKTTRKPPPRPMLEIQWTVAHMDGIPADQFDRAVVYDNLMLTEDMLWKIRQLMAACGTPCVCAKCQTSYPADPNAGISQGACPNCADFNFDVDLDFIDSANPLAQLEADTNENGQPICRIKAYIAQ